MEDKSQQVQVKKVSAPPEAEPQRRMKVFTPMVDIYETKDAFVLVADVPGVDDKSLDITVDKNVLTINGTVEPVQYKDHELSFSEYDVGNYHRSFVLSGDIDRDKIEATVKNGVLHLRLPKTEQMKVRKITIH